MILLNWIVKRCLEESEEYWKIEWLLATVCKGRRRTLWPSHECFCRLSAPGFLLLVSSFEQGWGVSWNQVTPIPYGGYTWEKHVSIKSSGWKPPTNMKSMFFVSEHLVSRFLWFHWALHAFLEPCVDWYRWGPLLCISSFLHGTLVVVKPFLPHKLHRDILTGHPSSMIQ